MNAKVLTIALLCAIQLASGFNIDQIRKEGQNKLDTMLKTTQRITSPYYEKVKQLCLFESHKIYDQYDIPAQTSRDGFVGKVNELARAASEKTQSSTVKECIRNRADEAVSDLKKIYNSFKGGLDDLKKEANGKVSAMYGVWEREFKVRGHRLRYLEQSTEDLINEAPDMQTIVAILKNLQRRYDDYLEYFRSVFPKFEAIYEPYRSEGGRSLAAVNKNFERKVSEANDKIEMCFV